MQARLFPRRERAPILGRVSDLAKKTAAKKTAKKTAAKKPGAAKAAASKPAAGTKGAGEKPAKKPASVKSASKATEAPAPAKKPSAKQVKPKAEKSGAKPSPKAPAKSETKKSDVKAATKPPSKSEPKAGPKLETKPDVKSKSKPDAKATAKPDKAADKPAKGKPAPTAPSSASPAPAAKDAPPKETKQKPKAKEDAPEVDADSKDDKKGARKGITIVEPAKKPAPKSKPASKYNPPVRPMLLGPGSKLTKPLIPSGPSAPKQTSAVDAPKSKRTKTPLTKAKLDKYRALLLAKRAELFGDVESMENEALRSESGGLSNTPQHLAEQGSESYDQSLSLNLAAQDRRVIKEIDEALKRIDEGIYGLCELTNLPIPEERLDEIPWARYTIEAARQLEQRSPVIGVGGNPGGYGQ